MSITSSTSPVSAPRVHPSKPQYTIPDILGTLDKYLAAAAAAGVQQYYTAYLVHVTAVLHSSSWTACLKYWASRTLQQYLVL